MDSNPRSLAVWEAFFRNAAAGISGLAPTTAVPDERVRLSSCLCYLLEPGQIAFEQFVDSSHLAEAEQKLDTASPAPSGCPSAIAGHALAVRSNSSVAEVASWSGQSERARVVTFAAGSAARCSEWTELAFCNVSEWGGSLALGIDKKPFGVPLGELSRTPRQLKSLSARYTASSTAAHTVPRP